MHAIGAHACWVQPQSKHGKRCIAHILECKLLFETEHWECTAAAIVEHGCSLEGLVAKGGWLLRGVGCEGGLVASKEKKSTMPSLPVRPSSTNAAAVVGKQTH
jgi:hypothetical protein